MKKRIEWIDYIKAFACLLVVFGHLVQSLKKSNIGNDNIYMVTEFLNWFIYLFHMPLFMCMSGYLYFKNKPNFSIKSYKEFEFKKIINLVVPYLTFYLIFLGINVMFSSSVNSPKGIDELLGIINNPMPPYWFLYALLCIFIVTPILERICNNNNELVFGIFVILKLVSFFINLPIYAINIVMQYGIWFYIAFFIKDINKTNKKYINVIYFIAYLILGIVYYNLKDYVNIYIGEIIKLIFAMLGIYISVECFKRISKNKFLATYKNYTFQIYLTHTIFAAGIRIILIKIGIKNYCIHFIIGMISSIYLPVLMSILSQKIGYTEFFFYPLKTINKYKNNRKELKNV